MRGPLPFGPPPAKADRMSEGDAGNDRILSAIALRLFAAFGFTVMNAAIKLAEAQGARLTDVLLFRQLFALPVVVVAIAATAGLGSIRTARIGAHVTRTLVGTASMTCMFATVLLLPLAETTTLQFTLPIFATILGALILRERVGPHRWAAVLAGFAGVLIVTRPGGGSIPALGIATGLAAAAFSALVSILLRQLSRTEPPATIVFWFSALSVPPLAVAFIARFQPHPPVAWAWLVAVGLLGGMAQLAMTRSLKLGPVSVVVPMDYSALIWASLLGWGLFGVLPDPATWLGGPIIAASGLYIVWREHVRRAEKGGVIVGE